MACELAGQCCCTSCVGVTSRHVMSLQDKRREELPRTTPVRSHFTSQEKENHDIQPRQHRRRLLGETTKTPHG